MGAIKDAGDEAYFQNRRKISDTVFVEQIRDKYTLRRVQHEMSLWSEDAFRLIELARRGTRDEDTNTHPPSPPRPTAERACWQALDLSGEWYACTKNEAIRRAEDTGCSIRPDPHGHQAPLAAPVGSVSEDPEERAWTWMLAKFADVEAGHDPNDRDYGPDDMIDAFTAGLAARFAPDDGCPKDAPNRLGVAVETAVAAERKASNPGVALAYQLAAGSMDLFYRAIARRSGNETFCEAKDRIQKQCAHFGGALGEERCLITERKWAPNVKPTRCALCPE